MLFRFRYRLEDFDSGLRERRFNFMGFGQLLVDKIDFGYFLGCNIECEILE